MLIHCVYALGRKDHVHVGLLGGEGPVAPTQNENTSIDVCREIWTVLVESYHTTATQNRK